jgi:hypothetical protein
MGENPETNESAACAMSAELRKMGRRVEGIVIWGDMRGKPEREGREATGQDGGESAS